MSALPRSWWSRGLAVAACALAVVGPAAADDLAEVRQRLERLEQQNQRLAGQNEELREEMRSLRRATPAVGPGKSQQGSPGEGKASGAKPAAAAKDKGETKGGQEGGDGGRKADEFREVGADLGFQASWKDGLNLETSLKDFRVHVGGRFDVDAAWFSADQELQTGPRGVGPLEDGADLRRARLRVDGQAYEVVEWLFEADFATAFEGQPLHAALTDVYADVTTLPVVGNLRVGHFREPFGLEALTSGNALTFLERSSAFEAFVPFRNVGVMFYDTRFDDRMTWAAGVFRTNSRNTGNPFDYGDGEYSLTGRVTFLPWYAHDGRCLLHLGAAFSHRGYNRDPGQEAARFRAFPGVRTGRYVFADTGPLVAESTDLAGAELGLTLGPWSLQGEYFLAAANDVLMPGAVRTPVFHGGYAQLSYFLTGEHRTYRRRVGQRTIGVFDRPRPHENFFLVWTGEEGPGHRRLLCGSGAWEVAARYSHVDLNDPGSGVNREILQDVTFGLNWYLNYNTKVQWNYLIVHRDAPGDTSDGVAHILAVRFHLDF